MYDPDDKQRRYMRAAGTFALWWYPLMLTGLLAIGYGLWIGLGPVIRMRELGTRLDTLDTRVSMHDTQLLEFAMSIGGTLVNATVLRQGVFKWTYYNGGNQAVLNVCTDLAYVLKDVRVGPLHFYVMSLVGCVVNVPSSPLPPHVRFELSGFEPDLTPVLPFVGAVYPLTQANIDRLESSNGCFTRPVDPPYFTECWETADPADGLLLARNSLLLDSSLPASTVVRGFFVGEISGATISLRDQWELMIPAV